MTLQSLVPCLANIDIMESDPLRSKFPVIHLVVGWRALFAHCLM